MIKPECAKARERLLTDLDQGLDQTDRARLEEHLALCEDCRKEQVVLRDIRRSLDSDRLPDPGEPFWREFRESLEAKLDAVPAAQRSAAVVGRWTWKIWAAAMAPALALLILAHFANFRVSPGQDPMQTEEREELVLELRDVYGPSPAETFPAAYVDVVVAQMRSKSGSWDVPAPKWFEVEDDPSQPFL